MIMGVGSGRQGGRAPLDFHTWYKNSRERLKSATFFFFLAIFRCFLLFFGLFFRCPLPPLEIFLPTPLPMITVFLHQNKFAVFQMLHRLFKFENSRNTCCIGVSLDSNYNQEVEI